MNSFPTIDLQTLLPFLIPALLLQLGLMLAALLHLLKHKKVKVLNLPIWLIIILFVNMLGPILYFIFGRDDE